MSDKDRELAASQYFTEIYNQLVRANEPLRLSIMLLSIATALGEEVPQELQDTIDYNKTLCDRMKFLCLPVAKNEGSLN